jgi:hypothetical protein
MYVQGGFERIFFYKIISIATNRQSRTEEVVKLASLDFDAPEAAPVPRNCQ